MDINSLRIVTTIASFVVFIGILVWVWQRRHTSDFKEAANLPFKDDQS
jgi:cytochrome c oxidase cbb3-type subunit 4